MSLVAAAVVTSAVVGASASRSASKAQANAANRASDLSQAQFEQNRADMTPWREAGMTALSDLSAGTRAGGQFDRTFTLADFQRDPGYQFRMDEGTKAIERSAAARGGLNSGATLKGLARYGQDFASGEYQNAYNRFNNDQTTRFNRLSSLAGTAQTATRDVAAMGTANANQIGSNLMQGANARASGYVGAANAFGNALGQYQNYTLMSKLLSGGGGGSILPGGVGAAPY